MPSLTFIGLTEISAQDLKPQPQSSRILGFPLTINIKSSEPYYHTSYSLSRPGVDLILASSDRIPCRFAISSTELAFHPEVLTRTNRVKIQFDAGLPLIQLDASKEVIEIILACLDSGLVPDLSGYTFDDLVGALEAVAGQYELEHVERHCLLAIGAYYKLKPIHVFSLAVIYGCTWMAKLASGFTLALDISLPQHKCLLSSEAYDALTELHTYRRKKAREILNQLRLPVIINHQAQNCSQVQLIEFWKPLISRVKRLSWNSQTNLKIKQLFTNELKKASIEVHCNECLNLMDSLVDQADLEFDLVRSWALPTSDSSYPC
ncbi:uncharacterized protein MELLADRAFT_73299 [Melampsora larici-populina 98AG31]|uniref:BTB domain-containing protein n=1 Tax=Melampsora larici-populina (strain 98AG31 / pathotype 3-4-7) TaxID=747676 RepID=F4S639_MELLP|nr:uncharacterized protein MELLADRAFT_73299 [Melampsora larici-populina 98AG31]EGF99910.1 hypothetical protein MELLADRAFT_73299 [Melampsora larici-populina 98AG31]